MAEKKTKKVRKKLFGGKKSEQSPARPRDYQIIVSPVVTEKSSLAGSQSSSGPGSTVVFRVDSRSNKDEIREAIERVFKVQVAKIRTVNIVGKPKRTTRSSGRRASYKKAYVTLKQGQTINVVEGL